MKIQKCVVVGLVILVFSGLALAITKEEVIQLSNMKVGDDVIIAKIQQDKSTFTLSTEDIIALKGKGISDKVIQFMIETGKKKEVPLGLPSPNAMGELLITVTVDATYLKKHTSIPGAYPPGTSFGFGFYWFEKMGEYKTPFKTLEMGNCVGSPMPGCSIGAFRGTFSASEKLKPGTYASAEAIQYIGGERAGQGCGPFEIKPNQTTEVKLLLTYQGGFFGKGVMRCTSHPASY